MSCQLQRWTEEIIDRRLEAEIERRTEMSRLTEKLAAAAAVAPRQAKKIEARADAIIASEAGLEEMTDDAFSVHEALLDEARKGVQDLKHELATMSNNPPLEPSAPSPAAAGAIVRLGPHPDQHDTEAADWASTTFPAPRAAE
jgi:hypothetical protein